MKKLLFMIIIWGMVNLLTSLLLKESGYVVSWGMFGLLLLSSILSIVVVVLMSLLFGVLSMTSIPHAYIGRRIPSVLMFSLFSVILLVLQAVLSQYFTYIPGELEQGSWEEVSINGTEQYISVRTKNEENPVLLFLAGGPGGSQIQATREHLELLEEEYTIINWEQPGSGKSYGARDISSLTVETYIQDGHALTKYLQETFNQDKIYIIGESWGSYLGVELATRYPEDYHALITTGQMVDFAETEIHCYEEALQIAYAKNDQQQIKALENIDEVPVRGDNISMETASYLMYLHQQMNNMDEIAPTSWDTFDTLFSPEYSIVDSLNFLRSLYFTFSHVYQQLYETDLRESHTDLDIPIYILHGRHDVNAPTYLVDEYFEAINAPKKDLIYFEHSGHNPWINESELFQQTVLRLLEN